MSESTASCQQLQKQEYITFSALGERPESRGVSSTDDDDENGLGRSYVCSLSSTVELAAGEDSGGLALSVQSYLSRIVEELHLISNWTAGVCQRQQQYQRGISDNRHSQPPRPQEDTAEGDDASLVATARLAVVTDMELLRRDVARAQRELFQRCTTQMAYVQSAASVERDKEYGELQRRVDDKLRAWDQQVATLQTLEKARIESDAQARGAATTLRQVQQQVSEHHARLAALEKSMATLSAVQFTQQQEVQVLQRRADSTEATQLLQQEATRRVAGDSLASLKAAQSQLTAKLQVLRLELQEHSKGTQRNMHQLLKLVGSGVSLDSGRPSAAAVTPHKPSVGSSRTGRPTGSTASAASGAVSLRHASNNGSGVSSDALDGILGGNAAVVMTTGAGAVATSDCFLYARAALPYREPSNENTTAAVKKPVMSGSSSRGVLSAAVGGSVAGSGGGGEAGALQDAMKSLLLVQQSVISPPLGYEDDEQPIPSTQQERDSSSSSSNSGAIHVATRSTPATPGPMFTAASNDSKLRHSSLPCVDPPAMSASPRQFQCQASRLHSNTTSQPPASLLSRSVLQQRRPTN